MFSWFYRVWMLENIFQRENVLLDTGKMDFNLGKRLTDFICVRHFPSPLHPSKFYTLLFCFLSSPLSQDLIPLRKELI
ncbi:hypothetical protein F383_13156 [Gossypium arboreum]|uniref:Uncharacterized protein n=1 Tax=Gossypium arboreum TaxID=29729 RepID=A0A0B0ND44_GOSAR|nr:hypothetical protein F383_13156 [Gossypium arboreum]